nr:MAG: ORF4 [Torque teno polar bear virus 46]
MGRRLRFGDRRGERCATSAIAPETPPKATAPTLEAGATAAEKARQISRRGLTSGGGAVTSKRGSWADWSVLDPPNLHKRGRAGQRGRAGHFRMGVPGGF